MGNINSSSMGFAICNNVEISVIDTRSNIITKHIQTHNKATRQMVSGLIRFLNGDFNKTFLQPDPQYSNTEQYIPCFLGCGDGGVVLFENSEGQIVPKSSEENIRVPVLEQNWTEYADYNAKKFLREFFTGKTEGEGISGTRSQIRKTTLTLEDASTADMDSTYFYCEVRPGELNMYYNNNPLFISEIGLFATPVPGTEDLLAYIKLGNYIEDDVVKTNTLYVRPDDTVVIRWVITIAAVGKDTMLTANVRDENGDLITTTIQEIPTIGDFELEEHMGPEPDPEPSSNAAIYIRDYNTREIVKEFEDGLTVYGLAKNWFRNESDPNKLYEFVITPAYLINENYLEIDNNGMANMTNLKKFLVYTNREHYMPGNYFDGCTNLEEVYFEGPIVQVRWNFLGNTNVKELSINADPSNCYIHNNAFVQTPNLERVYINRPENSIMGAPWGAQTAQIIWTG